MVTDTELKKKISTTKQFHKKIIGIFQFSAQRPTENNVIKETAHQYLVKTT